MQRFSIRSTFIAFSAKNWEHNQIASYNFVSLYYLENMQNTTENNFESWQPFELTAVISENQEPRAEYSTKNC